MEHQDWKTVVVRKKKGSAINNSENKVVNKTTAYNAGKNINNKNKMHSRKLDQSEDLKHTYVPKEVAMEIQKLRQAKGLTIKDLATRLNIPKQDLTNIEQGKALYNKAQINKIKRNLS